MRWGEHPGCLVVPECSPRALVRGRQKGEGDLRRGESEALRGWRGRGLSPEIQALLGPENSRELSPRAGPAARRRESQPSRRRC